MKGERERATTTHAVTHHSICHGHKNSRGGGEEKVKKEKKKYLENWFLTHQHKVSHISVPKKLLQEEFACNTKRRLV